MLGNCVCHSNNGIEARSNCVYGNCKKESPSFDSEGDSLSDGMNYMIGLMPNRV